MLDTVDTVDIIYALGYVFMGIGVTILFVTLVILRRAWDNFKASERSPINLATTLSMPKGYHPEIRERLH